MNRCLVTYDNYGTKLEFENAPMRPLWNRLVNAGFSLFYSDNPRIASYYQAGYSIVPNDIVMLVNMPVIVVGE